MTDIKSFVRAIERCGNGDANAIGTLAAELEVRLFVPTAEDHAPMRIPIVTLKSGENALVAFTSEASLRRWSNTTPYGTLPAFAIFESALEGPFQVLALNVRGPRVYVLERTVIAAALDVRSGTANADDVTTGARPPR